MAILIAHLNKNDLIVTIHSHNSGDDLTHVDKGGHPMHYQIIPLEMGSLVERQIFQLGNKEIKCGAVWKLGSVITKIKPSFEASYDPNLGICIQDIPGGVIGETYGGEKVIYFSETIGEDEQNELTDIFYENTKKYSKKYDDVFLDLGWIEVSSESYIFGEIEIKEFSTTPSLYK
jgi:hypothetical protein